MNREYRFRNGYTVREYDDQKPEGGPSSVSYHRDSVFLRRFWIGALVAGILGTTGVVALNNCNTGKTPAAKEVRKVMTGSKKFVETLED